MITPPKIRWDREALYEKLLNPLVLLLRLGG
jgi:hypothetical protein